ncbi:MAG TPA: DHH family phosphoesterase, partial [Candidatus Eremiobacteraeota bacterium]|nr:DHH family phosphoesterase [Candidatus Eremiobacteraeota bacterium]
EFLPLFDRIRTAWQENELYTVSIILDCGKWVRVGDVASIAQKSSTVINIDHHIDSQGIGKFNYINPQHSSTGEMLFYVLSSAGINLDPDIATCLYVAILSDTGRFRYSNTRSATLRVVADLLDTGINHEEIIGKIVAMENPLSLKLYSRIFSTVQTNSFNKIVWCTLYNNIQNDFLCASLEVESDKIFDELRTLKGFDVYLLFTELPENKFRVSFRSNIGIDVSDIARLFGGGGHAQACSCIIEGNLHNIQYNVIEKVERLFR